MNKIMTDTEWAPAPIREQLRAFREQVREVIEGHIRLALNEQNLYLENRKE